MFILHFAHLLQPILQPWRTKWFTARGDSGGGAATVLLISLFSQFVFKMKCWQLHLTNWDECASISSGHLLYQWTWSISKTCPSSTPAVPGKVVYYNLWSARTNALPGHLVNWELISQRDTISIGELGQNNFTGTPGETGRNSGHKGLLH